MLSADAFSAFEEAGLDDNSKVEETGHRFRDTVLALGGGRAPDLVFKVIFYLNRTQGKLVIQVLLASRDLLIRLSLATLICKAATLP